MAGIVNPGDEIKAEQINEVYDLSVAAKETAQGVNNDIVYVKEDINQLKQSTITGANLENTDESFILRLANGNVGVIADIDLTPIIDEAVARAKA